MLFAGDDRSEEIHDVELQDRTGRVLARAKLSADMARMVRLHALVAEHAGDVDEEDVSVVVGIETEQGAWASALTAAGYQVYPINPVQVARYRVPAPAPRPTPSDAHVLADLVRTDGHQLHPAASDSPTADAVKVVTRAHKSLIWNALSICCGCDRRVAQLHRLDPLGPRAGGPLLVERLAVDAVEVPIERRRPAPRALGGGR
jgi:hypothetical protein